RLPPFLHTIRAYFADRQAIAYEVIVIDDGSIDDSAAAVARLAEGWAALRLLRHPRNLGKGAAVRTGILAATGELLLFTDADGAIAIEEEGNLRRALEQGADIAVGSRLVDGAAGRLQRSWYRHWSGWLFARVVRHLMR